MEALAPAGAIQITKETLEATAGKFKTEKQAPIAVKGKGLMETWLVTGIQETAGNTAPEAAA
jgi:class 3 adenylate cyclase